jgi:hypothetical protein
MVVHLVVAMALKSVVKLAQEWAAMRAHKMAEL